MHTTPNTTEPTTQPTLRDLQAVMIRVQIKALETLERLMNDQELTGNEKTDKAKATERNRQRLAATQTLIHCRTMQRELREKREQSHRIRQDERAAQSRAPHQLATLRRLHKQSPDEYDNPDVPVCSSGTSRARQEAASPPSPLAGEGGRASDRMRGRPEPSDCSDNTTSGCAADPSPQPSPASAEPAEPHQDITPQPTPMTPLEAHHAEMKRLLRERIKAKREAMMQRKGH